MESDPWSEVHSRAENVAARVLDDEASAVGLVGGPTIELLSAIPGAVLAGAALSIYAREQQSAHDARRRVGELIG